MIREKIILSEVTKWLNDGLIDEQTALKITNRYNQNTNESSNVLRLVGYFFLACSLLSIVGANWDLLTPNLRTLLLIGVTAAVNFVGFRTLWQGKTALGGGLLVLGSLIFGVSIALISQIYHLDKNIANGVLLWVVGTFIIALISQNAHVMALSICAAVLWIFCALYVGVSVHIFLIFWLCGLFFALRQSSRWLVISLFFGIEIYLLLHYRNLDLFYGLDYFIIFSALALALLLLSLRHILIKFNQSQNAYYLAQTAAFFLAVIIFVAFSVTGFDISRDFTFAIDSSDVFEALPSYYGVLFLTFCFISAAIAVKFRDFVTLILAIFTLALPFVLPLVNAFLLYFTLMIALGVWLVMSGRFMLGSAVLFYTAMLTYLRLFNDYIGTSVLFLVFALFMIFFTKFRKKR